MIWLSTVHRLYVTLQIFLITGLGDFIVAYDANMAIRTLEYNVLASRQYDHMPVYSVVIYLRDKGGVPISPYVRDFIDERPVHLFFYNVVKLWEIPAETIFQMNLTGLLPLIPLTKNGKQSEHVQAMIDRLARQKEMDLLSISNIIGTLAFTEADEREWFKRRFFMFQDILQDSWMIQEIREDFLMKVLKKDLSRSVKKSYSVSGRWSKMLLRCVSPSLSYSQNSKRRG